MVRPPSAGHRAALAPHLLKWDNGHTIDTVCIPTAINTQPTEAFFHRNTSGTDISIHPKTQELQEQNDERAKHGGVTAAEYDRVEEKGQVDGNAHWHREAEKVRDEWRSKMHSAVCG